MKDENMDANAIHTWMQTNEAAQKLGLEICFTSSNEFRVYFNLPVKHTLTDIKTLPELISFIDGFKLGFLAASKKE